MTGPARSWACDPYAAEVPGNDTDEDCDGRITARRALVSAFSSADAPEWTAYAGASFDGDALVLDASGGLAVADYATPIAWGVGQAHAHVDVELSGNYCELQWQQDMGTPASAPLVDGLNDIPLGLDPLLPVPWLSIACMGASTTRVDWLTLGNSDYAWAPAQDIELTYSDAQFPGGGTLATVTIDVNTTSETLYAGADTGGFAVSYDGFTWETRNGRFDDLVNETDLAIWGIAHQPVPPVDPGNPMPHVPLDPVYILTGDTSGGALLRTEDDGLDWEVVSRDVGGAQYTTPSGTRSMAAGHLLHADQDNLYIASQLASGFTIAGDRHGVYVLDSNGQLCEPYSGLPQATDVANRARYIPTALAELTIEVFGVPWRQLLVGYREAIDPTMAVSGGAALYRCPMVAPASACSMPPLTCAPIAGTEGWDVRDIATYSDPGMPDGDRAYVVDGGWRWYYAGVDSSGQPVHAADDSADGTVHVVAFDGGGNPHPWDSDGDALAEPDWLASTGALFSDQCNTDHAGNLTPASWTTSPSQLAGVAVSAAGEGLFAFYHVPSGQANYGCPRVYHADPQVSVSGEFPTWAAEDDLYWEPFQGEQSGTDYDCADGTCNNIERRAMVDAAGHWIDDQPVREVFAPSYALDGTFVELDFGYGKMESMLVNDGRSMWVVPPEVTFWPTPPLWPGWSSWDNIDAVDLDDVSWYGAFDGNATFETTVVNDIAVCHGCGNSATEGTVHAALYDLGGARLFTDDPAGYHERAEVDCHWDGWGALGSAIDVGEGSIEGLEMSVIVQGTRSTESIESANVAGTYLSRSPSRGLHWSLDEGATFCHDGAELNDRDGYTLSALGDELFCEDWHLGEPTWVTPWSACDPLAALGLFETMGVPRDIAVVEPALSGNDIVFRALVTATAVDEWPAPGGNGEFDVVDLDLAGLFVATYDPAAPDTSYTKVGNWTDFTDASGYTCEEWEFFDGAVEIALLPDSQGDHFHVVLAGPSPREASYAADQPFLGYVPEEGEPCGVREVEWDAGNEAAATWRYIDLDDAVCALAPYRTGGVTVATAEWQVMVYGRYGTTGGAYMAGGICAVDLAGTYDPVAMTYPHQQIVSADAARITVTDVMPHPHVADTWFYGGYINGGDPDTACYVIGVGYTTCTTPTLTILQRRPAASGATWDRVPIEEDSILHKRTTDLDWAGEDPWGGPAVDDIWVATAGGGVFEGTVSW